MPTLDAPPTRSAARDGTDESAHADDHASAHDAEVPPGTPCATCGGALHGAYCHRCGEKRLDRHDYSLAHFAEHAVDTVTHFDFKVAKGAWSLLRRPGRMSGDVLAGRRVPWPRPLQLFLVVNVVFYLVAGTFGANIFDTPLRHQVDMQAYGPLATRMTEAKLAAEGPLTPAAREAYTARFDAKAHGLSKSLVFLFIPLVTLALALFQAGRRRYALEHVTVATHLVTAVLLVLMGVLVVLIMLGALGLLSRGGGDGVASVLFVLGFGAVVAGTFRHAYGDPWRWAVLKGAGFAATFLSGIVLTYRFVLFLVVHALA